MVILNIILSIIVALIPCALIMYASKIDGEWL
jgi:hypothetical protein